MPLDVPREDDFDDSLPDIPDYQLMNIANDDNDNDSDFNFSSDEEDENIPDDLNRYANYELISQGNETNDTTDTVDQSLEDNSNNEGDNPTRNRFFQHNLVVQWIETDEPLFDRQQYELQQQRQRQTLENENNAMEPQSEVNDNYPLNVEVNQSISQSTESTSKLTDPSLSKPCSDKQTCNSKQQNEVRLDTDKIDVIKGLMSNFKLPDENYPNWTKEIPEDQWKTFLVEKFHDKSPSK